MADPPEAPFDISLLDQSDWPEWWHTHPPWSQDPELDDLLRLALPKEQAEWKRGGQTFQWREDFLRMLQGRWRSLAPRPPKPRSAEVQDLEKMLQSYVRGMEAMGAERATVDKQLREWAEQRERTAARHRETDQRIHEDFDAIRSGLGELATIYEREKREKPPTAPVGWLKIFGACILAFAALIGAIATAFQQAGIINVFLAHLILIFGWLGFVASFLLLEHFVSLPLRRMIKLTIFAALLSGVFMLAMDRWMVSLKAAQTIAPPGLTPTTPSSQTESVPPTKEKVFTDVKPEYLVGLYQKYNSAQADQVVKTYIGQPLKASGVVSDVRRDGDDVSVVLMVKRVDGWTLYAIAAAFDEQRWKDRAVVLSKGEKVTVLGKIRGVSDMSILLEHCEIIE